MFSPALVLALLATALTANASCLSGTSFFPRQEGTVEVGKFGYTGLQGPLNWAGLFEENAACASSKVQSPIVLTDAIPKAPSAPKVEIENVEETEFENKGTTLEVVIEGKTTFEGAEFELKQFHFHTPSEHRINDEYFPLEIHMVHEGANGAIAVIAIPFQLTEDGKTTELLTAVIENIEDVREPGTATKTGALDFKELIEAIESRPLFLYTGSLTTPPCAEGLTFLVMEEPLDLDVKTFNTIKSVIKFNSRYSQNDLGETNLLEVASELSRKTQGVKCSDEPQSYESKMVTISMEKVREHCDNMCQHKKRSLTGH
jgi:carbonic anhydrase